MIDSDLHEPKPQTGREPGSSDSRYGANVREVAGVSRARDISPAEAAAMVKVDRMLEGDLDPRLSDDEARLCQAGWDKLDTLASLHLGEHPGPRSHLWTDAGADQQNDASEPSRG